MSKITTFDPSSTEIKSPLIAGLTEAVSKISEVLDMQATLYENVPMTEIFIDDTDRYRMYQVDMGKRLWLSDPTPVIRKNGSIINSATNGFSVDLIGGSVSFEPQSRLLESDSLTATFTSIKAESKVLYDVLQELQNIETKLAKDKGFYETYEDLKTSYPTGNDGDFAVVGSTDTMWVWDTTTTDWKDTFKQTDLSNFYTKAEADGKLALKEAVLNPYGGVGNAPDYYFGGNKQWIDLLYKVRNTLLTGVDVTAIGTISELDNMISAFGKLQKQITDNKSETVRLESTKVEKVTGKVLSSNDYTTTEKTKLAGVETGANKYMHPTSHPATITVQDATHRFATDTEKNLWNTVSNKVDKVTGKQLSTEDFSTVEKTKLSGIATGANNYIHPAGTNPHGTTKADIGLGSAENTTDIDKPISTATQNALNGKVGNERVLTNVPSGAKFTDTIYTHPASHPASMITDLPTVAKVARFVVGTSTAGWTLKDCDYLCDGTADQTEINAAITALPATGGEIVILDGTYNITAKIDVTKNNVSIKGNGNATILKRMYNSSVKEGVITLTSRSGCKIANLQIEGNKTSYSNNNNFGIYLSSSNNNTITGNTCNNNNYGIYLSSSNNNTITGNTCNSDGPGIYLSSSSNNTITGNTCNSNRSSTGIEINNSSHNTITGNTCNNNNFGIYLSSSSNNTITGNTCNNNSNYGIYLSSSSNNTITGNTCNNNNYGIYLSSSNNNTITGNTCIRGTGQASDYTDYQYTVRLSSTTNNYNLISSNNCMGKAVTNGGGTGNTLVNNKFDAT